MSEYRWVWINSLGAICAEPNGAYPPYVEHKVVPGDAVVIERDEVPAVDPERAGYSGYVGLTGPGSAKDRPVALLTPERHMERAMEEIALSLYAQAHPPVDEAQVEALAVALVKADTCYDSSAPLAPGSHANLVARRLIEQGWSKPEVGRG